MLQSFQKVLMWPLFSNIQVFGVQQNKVQDSWKSCKQINTKKLQLKNCCQQTFLNAIFLLSSIDNLFHINFLVI
jgi:hypothetical protein